MGGRIGQLARESGVTPDTIRYYERLGLLPRSTRASNGYREFPDGAVMDERIAARICSKLCRRV